MALVKIVLFGIALFFWQLAWIDNVNSDRLPRATRKGKNTFGCLVNGKIWVPQGRDGKPNLDLLYDYTSGTFNLGAYRYLSHDENDRQDIVICFNRLTEVKKYKLDDMFYGSSFFGDRKMKCNYFLDSSVYRKGGVTITKLDIKRKIISGTFEFTLAKPKCDTIKVTEGRFDMEF